MKKFLVISVIFIFIILIAVIGSLLITPNKMINKVDDIMESQKMLESDYSCYGYSIDNPKIVVNPYKIAPLSALIMFETENKEKIKVYLVDKNGISNLLYEEDKDGREHYLDIYGMYIGENKVILEYNEISYDYVIDTKLDVVIDNINVDEKVMFDNYNSDLVGSRYGEILYYYYGYNKLVKQLDNGHLLVTSSRVNNDGSYVGFSEIDMIGRIYNDYIIENGYSNIIYVMENGNYLILSDDVIEIDKQNGNVVKRFKLDDKNDIVDIYYNNDNNVVVIKKKDKELYYDYDKLKLVDEKDIEFIEDIDNKIDIKYGNYYSKLKQNRFGYSRQTSTNNTNVNLLINKDQDNKYKECNIKSYKEFDRIVIKKSCDDTIYLVLDRFMNKKIYKVDKDMFYVNDTGLKGEYIIYYKIGKDIYKSGYYVKIS